MTTDDNLDDATLPHVQVHPLFFLPDLGPRALWASLDCLELRVYVDFAHCTQCFVHVS